MTNLVPIPLALFEHLSRVGLDVEAILRRANLTRDRFNVARPEGTTAEFFALWHAVEELGAAPDLGLRLGIEFLPDDGNVVSLAAMNAATLGDGLRILARYKHLVCPEKISISSRGGEVQMRFEWLLASENPPAFLMDAVFAGVLNLAQCGTRTPLKPLRLEFSSGRGNELIFQRHFQCEIRFHAPHDLLVFDEAALALPMAHQNAQLLSVLAPGLELALASHDETHTMALKVREVLGEAIHGGRPTIAKIAKALALSVRTLQRRLGELGTTYQELLNEVRHQSARHLLRREDLSLGEIAFLLGFEELNSFVRAFQSWEGTTPARWRELIVTRHRKIQSPAILHEVEANLQ